jgi:rhodanese-related sulfurtransferase
VAQQLQDLGFEARALLGGYDAWKAHYPVEDKTPV